LNGCITGPGLYQEWTNHIYAAKNSNEQNLELCRSRSNNMLYYRASRFINKGEHLLAWYSCQVENELFQSLPNIDDQINNNNNKTSTTKTNQLLLLKGKSDYYLKLLLKTIDNSILFPFLNTDC
jgi:hypothetical protein